MSKKEREDELLQLFSQSNSILSLCGNVVAKNNAITYAKKLSLATGTPYMVFQDADGKYFLSDKKADEKGSLVGTTSLIHTKQGICCYFN